MNKSNHEQYEDQLVLYVSGQLDSSHLDELKEHLSNCEQCREELKMWQMVNNQIADDNEKLYVPQDIAEKALQAVNEQSGFKLLFSRAINLLRAQIYLVQREMWPASAILMLMAVVITVILDKLEFLRVFAPMVAAGSLAAIFAPEQDPAWELSLSSPTSRWKVFLARMTVVHGYNLILALLTSLFTLLIIPVDLLWPLILSWLGPLTFLSALALLLSMRFGTGNSIAITYGFWIIQFPNFEMVFSQPVVEIITPFLNAYRSFWSQPALLICLGTVLFMAVLFAASKSTLNGIQSKASLN